MAAQQAKRHQLGRKGETIINKLVGGKKTNHKAPFDIVDFQQNVAYEVKAMSGLSKDLKIHISDSSMKRKLEFAEQYNLNMVLIAVVIYSKDNVEVYSGELKQSMRINQMVKIK